MMTMQMPRAGAVATIRSGALAGLGGFLEQRGVTTPALCERVGINPALLANPESRMAVRGYVDLLESAASQTHSDTLGLNLGYRQPLATMGTLGEVTLRAPDIASAIRSFADAMPLHQEGARLALEVQDERALLSYSVSDAAVVEYRQDAELSVAKMLHFARVLLRQPQWTPTAVYFEHPAPADTQAHRRLFGVPVYFSQDCNALVFPSEMLKRRICGSVAEQTRTSAQIPALLRRQATAIDLLGELRLQITRAMKDGGVSIVDSAATLGMSERTLQRRLGEFGLSYNSFVERIRFELSQRYLQQAHLPLTEIGYLLGYSELSAFSRAFRRWAGESPQSFRRRGRCAN
ncbi:MAG: AraC family transcriptional regulator [Nevskia sp.]|nr:AraC family transcriptional regulator [Nevskia sp.]